MELNYALQSKVELLPLMLEEGYEPKGWCADHLTRAPHHCCDFGRLIGALVGTRSTVVIQNSSCMHNAGSD